MTRKRNPTGRPQPGEYADYAADDIALVPGDDAIAALVQLQRETEDLFGGLDAPSGEVTYAPGKWTIKQILGHLADDERIFAYRALNIGRGDPRPLPGFDENLYATGAEFDRLSLDQLLADYVAVRQATLSLLRGFPAAAWTRRGTVSGYAATPRGLAFHIAGHELHHHRVLHDRYLPRLRKSSAPD